MNADVMINRLAYVTGSSRKQVISALRQMGSYREVQEVLKKMQNVQKRNK